MYAVKEIFYSLQGEGVRAGIPHIFLRFAGCNLDCKMQAGPLSPGGFDCDTDWKNGTAMSIDQLIEALEKVNTHHCKWVLLTGGEPAMQLDTDLIDCLIGAGYNMAIETNGTVDVSPEIDWISCSPKVGPYALQYADEVRCVLAVGQTLPDIEQLPTTEHYLVSPANDGDQLNRENAEWCMKLVLDNPMWRMSMQYHKVLKIR